MVGGCPVAVAVEQRPDDAPVQDVGEGLVVRLGLPGGDDLVPLDDALDPKALGVGRAASEALVVGSIAILQALHDAFFKASGASGPPV
jgi:hypothetical protein